mmetsp:Transcript_86525/g.158478  ORF Transcript_86525/g.158478 Transcript_86525/m.158478 type:complete len:357 (+) Transcript_86525:13-1083(+)
MEAGSRRNSLSSVDRLLGPKSSSKERGAVVSRPGLMRSISTGKAPRRRHTMDDRVRPHAYTGKIFGAVPLQNRTYDDRSAAERLARKRSPDLKADLPKFSSYDDRISVPIVKPVAADSSDALACQLALKHRLMLSEVKRIIREFISVKHSDTGGVEREDFNKALARIFDVPAVNERVSASAYKATNAHIEIDIENFLAWYVQNMFTQVNALNASPEMSASDQLIYQLAEKHGVSNFVVDKIKVKFDHFDTNRNGNICYQEFQDMFCAILKARNIGELNEQRIIRFWSQIHKENPAEGADFTEFAEWYLKYFSADTEEEDWDMLGPLRKFYDSFDPTVQRRNSLRGLSRVASMPGNL